MPNDLVTLRVLVGELDALLCGGKIDRITQPEKDGVVLSIRNNSNNFLLFISCAPECPRIYLTRKKKENPLNAPSFCMLLRKYLEKSSVLSVGLTGGDRIISLNCLGRNTLFEPKNYTLTLELMSRHSNIFLTDENDRILGAVKQTFLNENSERLILPGAPYSPPKNNKIRFNDEKSVRSLLLTETEREISAFRECEISAFISKNISGISKEIAKEIAVLAGLDGKYLPISEEQANYIIEVIKRFTFPYKGNYITNDIKIPDKSNENGSENEEFIDIKPCLAVKNGIPVDFFIAEYSSVKAEYRHFDLLNDALDEFYSDKEKADSVRRKAKALGDILKKAVVKTEKKLADNRDSLFRSENAENLKKFGNLILQNIHLIKNKSQNFDALDYENGETVSIPLDKNLSPSENAAAYFKKYSKLKRTGESVKKNLEQNSLFLEYLMSIESGVAIADDTGDLAEIENELFELGLIKTSPKNAKNNPKKGKNNKNKPAANLQKTAANIGYYRCEIDGFTVYAGKNNAQNDYVTFSLAKAGDIWLHTKNYHGAHVVISLSNHNPNAAAKSVPENVLAAAAGVAAYFSKARQSAKVPVDYTERRNVKKIPAAGKGMVTYTDFKTILAEPKLFPST